MKNNYVYVEALNQLFYIKNDSALLINILDRNKFLELFMEIMTQDGYKYTYAIMSSKRIHDLILSSEVEIPSAKNENTTIYSFAELEQKIRDKQSPTLMHDLFPTHTATKQINNEKTNVPVKSITFM